MWVPAGRDPLEIWDVEITNLTSRTRRISLISHVVMKCDGTDLDHGELYRTAKYIQELKAVYVKQDAERHQFMNFPMHNAFMTCDPPPVGWNANPGTFVGARRSIANPLAVEKGELANAQAILYTPTVSL